MTAQRYYFAGFVLDPAQRRLFSGKQQLELNARYLDALLLLVQDAGKLVSKERFFAEVWQGMVVSDEALTQCIRTLRRQLQDSAGAPRFIETVPKHGYRFIANVRLLPAGANQVADSSRRQKLWQLTGHGALGAALAGLIGGMLYGALGAALALVKGNQALSVLLVTLTITTLIALLAGAAVSLGLALARLSQPAKPGFLLLAGAAAGLVIGGFVSLLLQETFILFVGRSPAQITGASEGLILGLAAGCSYWLLSGWQWAAAERKRWGFGRLVISAALPGMLAGLLLSVSGGVLLAGSLAQLAAEFPDAAVGGLQAVQRLKPAQGVSVLGTVSAMLEAGLFTAGLALGLQRAR